MNIVGNDIMKFGGNTYQEYWRECVLGILDGRLL